MTRVNVRDMEFGFPNDQPPPLVSGSGTFERPYNPSATDYSILEVMRIAKERGEPVWCQFEESMFRIHPNGSFKAALGMPSMRDGIQAIFESTTERLRTSLGETGN